MRLAALFRRPVAELRETMDAHEWSRWLLFNELYDLPDAFLVAGQLGALISQVVGGKGKPENFAPYYRDLIARPPASSRRPGMPVPAGNNDLRPAYNFIAAYAKERAESGRPLPRSTRKDGA
jgi:hypothetical protein